MPFEQIIAIAAFFLVLVFVWGIAMKLFKILFYVGIIIFLLLAANLFFIYQDFKDLKENFSVSEKKVILADDGRILTGLLLGEETDFMTNSQLEDYSSYLKNSDYDKILGDSYKLMAFDAGIISDIDDVELGGITITADEALSILRSDANQQEKASLFSVILADEILSSKNPLFFFSEFKEGNIVIYPETALFKTIKIMPVDLFRDVAKTLFSKTKEKAKAFIVEEAE